MKKTESCTSHLLWTLQGRVSHSLCASTHRMTTVWHAHQWHLTSPATWRKNQVKIQVCSYIVQYPTLRIVQSALHYIPWQTCSINWTSSQLLWEVSNHAAINAWRHREKYPPLSIKYSYSWVNTRMNVGLNSTGCCNTQGSVLPRCFEFFNMYY